MEAVSFLEPASWAEVLFSLMGLVELSLMFCHHLEILSNFWTRDLAFSFCTGSHNLFSWPCSFFFLTYLSLHVINQSPKYLSDQLNSLRSHSHCLNFSHNDPHLDWLWEPFIWTPTSNFVFVQFPEHIQGTHFKI